MRELVAIGVVIVLLFGGLVTFAFFSESFNVKWREHFDPQYADVKRKTFENSQSFVHGKTQELAKYYKEYNEGDATVKKIIQNQIQATFSTVDANDITSEPLRDFLVEQRGY